MNKDMLKFVLLYTVITGILFLCYTVFEIDLPILLSRNNAIKVLSGLGLVLSLLIQVLINKIKGE